MQTKDQLGGIKERILIHRLLGASVGALAVFLLGFFIVPVLIAEASATENALAGVSWGAVSLTLDPDVADSDKSSSTHGDVNFGELIPSTKAGGNYGTLKVLKKTIGVTTSGKYYSVFISTNSTNNNLNYAGSESAANIPAIASDGTNAGTWAEPAQLMGNGWGFAVPATPIPVSKSSSTLPSFGLTSTQFSSSDITAILDTQITKEEGNTEAKNTLYTATRWAAVPIKSAPQQIYRAESSSVYGFGTYTNGNNVEVTGDTDNDHFDIYYAIMVNTGTLAGTYSNQIVYTALASATAIDEVSNNIIISTNIGGQQEPETVMFELSESAGAITEDMITIALVPHKELLAANYMELNDQEFTLNKLGHDISYYATTYGTCAIDAGSLEISDGSDGSISQLTCKTPNVNYRNTHYEYDGLRLQAARFGTFDLWMNIAGYDYNYITKVEYDATNYVGAYVYAGLQSTYSRDVVSIDTDDDGTDDVTVAVDPRHVNVNYKYDTNKIITSMQQITPRICALTRRWNNQTGDGAIVFEPRTDEDARTTSTPGPEANAIIGVGTFELEDERDGKHYLVRRLADGNCWMVQNLALDLDAVADGTITLNNTNTDLNTKSSWSPDSATITSSFVDAEDARMYDNGLKYADTDPQTGNLVIATDSTYDASHATSYIGNFYNWYAATAETGTPEMEGQNTFVDDSICAKGWKLPATRQDNGQAFYTLVYGRYGINNIMDNLAGVAKLAEIPLSFVPAGSVLTQVSHLGQGLYMSNQGSNSRPSYFSPLDYYTGSGNIYMPGSAYKTTGGSIRCVARK